MKFQQEKSQEVINTIEVPDSIRQFANQIPNLYKEGNLPPVDTYRKSDKMKSRKWMLPSAAAIGAVFVLGIGFISPTVASVLERVPFLEIAYKNETPFYGFSDASKSHMTTKINQTVIDNGVGITLNEAVYDGIRLGLSYTIETEEDIKSIGPRLVGDDLGVAFSFNGKEPENWGFNWDSKRVGPNTFVAIQSIPYVKQFDDKYMKLSVEYSALGEEKNTGNVIEGNWAFKDIPIKKLHSKKIRPNENIQSENISAVIKELHISPLTTRITVDQAMSKEKDFTLIIKDNSGGELKFMDTNRSLDTTETPVFESDFETLNADSSYLDVILVNNKNKEERAEVRIHIK